MPLASQNIPSVLIESANLANPADNELSRLYPHERLPGVLRGIADYFIEQEQCITFDSLDKVAPAAAPAVTTQAVESAIDTTVIDNPAAATGIFVAPIVENLGPVTGGNSALICDPNDTESICNFLKNYQAPEPIILDENGVQISGIPLQNSTPDIPMPAAMDSIVTTATSPLDSMINTPVTPVEADTVTTTIPLDDIMVTPPSKAPLGHLFETEPTQPDSLLENKSKVDTLNEERAKPKIDKSKTLW